MKIYGTLGPSCNDAAILRKMFEIGITGMRLNLSHVTLKESREMIDKFHTAEKLTGRKIDLLIDMQGPEMRLGKMKSVRVKEGNILDLGGEGITVPDEIIQAAEINDVIMIDDGKLVFDVIETNDTDIQVKCRSDGEIIGRKSIAIQSKSVTGPVLTEQDYENLRDARDLGVNEIMQPFVRSASDLREVRNALNLNGNQDFRILAKIENMEGLSRLDEIMQAADVVVIARGDLGNAMPLWRLPAVQKDIAEKCRRNHVPFLVVTQMLASMEDSPVPTRAEVSDIYNAVLDGCDAVMLTGETAVGKYPVEAAAYLVNTVNCALENI